MKRQELVETLTKINKTIFSMADLVKLFPSETNLKTSLHRLRRGGVVEPVSRGIYRLAGQAFDIEQTATQMYYPSYISFETVLAKYGVINQGSNRITLATTRHSKRITLSGIEIHYRQVKPELFFGFKLMSDTYIADVEKALLDEIYFMSLKKRTINTAEWSFESINKKIFTEYAAKFPGFTQRLAHKIVTF
jgi:predicted transcriptional regulator of viral defense system